MSLKNYFFYFFIFLVSSTLSYSFFFFSPPDAKKNITVMIDPAGDAQHTGRKLDDHFERGITLQIAEKLKINLEERFNNVKIILSRAPGQAASYLQHASFANRLNVDFFLSIHCYREKATKSNLYVYQFSYGDDFVTKKFDLALIPYDQAHLANIRTTNDLALAMHDVLNCHVYSHRYITQGVFKIPFKPLIGIKAPAIGIEFGLKDKTDWHEYLEPIQASLVPIIEKLS